MIQPFSEVETKKYAVLDVANIVSTVGLIQKTDTENNNTESPNRYYIIPPSTSFNKDISVIAGKIYELL